MNAFEKLLSYMQYPFVQNALIVGTLIAVCAAVLGVTLVLRRYSYIGDGLSHVSFGAMAIAGVIGLTNDLLLIMPITVVVAILLLCPGKKSKIKGDASVAMISVASLALGYLLINRFSSSANISADVCSSLFGATSILTLSTRDVWLCIGMSVLVFVLFILFYHKIFAVTFDASFAQASGVRARVYHFLLATVTAIVISLSMRLVGSLLISALIIFPALSAMRLFRSFKSVVICSAVVSVVCALIGILSSILLGTPVGSTIVVANVLVFLLFSGVRLLVRPKG